jgi:hypothetical protein
MRLLGRRTPASNSGFHNIKITAPPKTQDIK